MPHIGEDSNQPKECEDGFTMQRNAKNGMRLFIFYALFYVGFVLLNAFTPHEMGAMPFGSLNLAVLYGGSLISLAIILALVYSWLCRSTKMPERIRQ